MTWDQKRINRSEYPVWNSRRNTWQQTTGFWMHNALGRPQPGASQYIRTESGLIGNFPMKIVENRWTPENIDAAYPRPYDRDKEYWVSCHEHLLARNTDYLRLKTMEIGYTIRKPLQKRIGLMTRI